MGRVTAVTYNVQHAILDEGPRWDRRRSGVVARLRDHNPDVIGLQECTGEQHADIASALPGYDWVGVADEPGSGEHNPIGYSDDWSLVETETVWLSESGKYGTVGWDGEYPRVVTGATLRDESGESLTVFNTHFDHLGTQARLESATQVRSLVDDRPAARPVLAIGDFNAGPNTPAYERLTAGNSQRTLVDAREVATTVTGPDTTLTDFEAVQPERAIDHVFVTPNVDVGRYVVDTTRRGETFPSDHLPVVVAGQF